LEAWITSQVTSMLSMRITAFNSGISVLAGVTSSPAIIGGVVYVGAEDDNVYALNATDGAVIWNYTTIGLVGSSQAVVNGVVYIGSYDSDTLLALGTLSSSATTSSNALFITVGVMAVVVIVVVLVFLVVFRERLKTKPKSPHLSLPISQAFLND
jgi:PQQ-like domain